MPKSDAEPVHDRRQVTIGIVEDDVVLRECLSQMVSDVAEFSFIGAAATLAAGFELLASEPDVLLVDLQLPDGNGLELIARARITQSSVRLLVLTVFADVRSVVRAIEEGADGYLLKEADTDQIVASIHQVLAGGAPLSPAVAGHILAKIRGDARGDGGAASASGRAGEPGRAHPTTSVTLTAKETAVLEALASGRSFKEVAAQQSISLHTVGDHVKSIYRKLSVNSRGEAVFKAMQTGLIRFEG